MLCINSTLKFNLIEIQITMTPSAYPGRKTPQSPTHAVMARSALRNWLRGTLYSFLSVGKP